MKKLSLAIVFSVSLIGAAHAAPVDQAIKALYAANNTVQRAVDLDACQGFDMLEENKTARAKLSLRNARAYDVIASALGQAYEASAGTDSALEQVNAAFCEASSNR